MRATHTMTTNSQVSPLSLCMWLGQLWAPIQVSTVRDGVTLSHV